MTYVMIRLIVEDLGKWKLGFEQAGALRKNNGSQGVRAFSKADSPKEVMILAEYEDREKAGELLRSEEFRDATQRAGVTGTPEVTFLDEVMTLIA